MLEKKFRKVILLPIMSAITVLWVLSSIQSRNLLMRNSYGYLGLLLILCYVVISYGFRWRLRPKIEKCLNVVYERKYVAIIVLFLFQIFLIFATQTVPGFDMGILIRGAIGEENLTYYLNWYPNNVLLYMFIRLLVIIFGSVWFLPVLLILNAIAINVTILGLIEIANNLEVKIKQQYLFAFGIFFMGVMPWVLIPYTDTFVLPFVTLGMLAIVKLQKGENYVLWGIVLGLAIAITYQLKPSAVIFVIAIVILKILKVIQEKKINLKLILVILGTSVSMLSLVRFASDVLLYAELDPNNAFPPTHWMMMGLAGNGEFNEDDFLLTRFTEGRDARIAMHLQEIRSRLNEMGVDGYASFIMRKFYFTFEDGTFGWGNEGRFLYSTNPEFGITSPFFVNFRNLRISRIFQYFIFSDSEGIRYLRFLSSIPYLVFVAGIAVSTFTKPLKKELDLINWLQLSIIGSVAFLMLFEAGRSRYLIQFFPQMAILSVIGLSKLEIKIVEMKEHLDAR